ncbi:MAG: hypothetical protein ACLRT4_02775 [Thomasclavelia sp.]
MLTIQTGYKSFPKKINDLIGILWSVFGSDQNKDFIIEELNKVWGKYEKIGGNLFISFIKVYGTIRPEETLAIVKELIDESELKMIDVFQIDFSTHSYSSPDNVLELIEQFDFAEYVCQVIDLLCEYAEKRQDLIKDVYERILCNFTFKLNSYVCNYSIQNDVMNTINSKRSSNVITKLYLGLAKYFLKFEYEANERGRGHSFNLYRFSLQNNSGSMTLRKNIWNELINISDDIVWNEEILDIFYSYSIYINDKAAIELLKKDKFFIIELIGKFKSDNLKMIRACSRIKRKWQKYGIDYNDEFEFLFETDLWNVYKLFGSDDFRGSNYRNNEKLRKKEVIAFAKTFDFQKIRQFIIYLNDIVKTDDRKSYIVEKYFECFINEFKADSLKLKIILSECMEVGQEIYFYPKEAIQSLLNEIGAEETYSFITSKSYSQQNYWQYTFFDLLPLDNINEFWADECLKFLKKDNDILIKKSPLRELQFLEKFENIRSNIFFDGCEIICNKYQYSPFIVSIYFDYLFYDFMIKPDELYKKFENNILLLRKIYFLQINCSQHTDYDGKYLNYFIAQDKIWLEEYVIYLYNSIKNTDNICKRLSYSWKQDNYMEIYDYIFDKFTRQSDDYFHNAESQLKHLFIHKKGHEQMAVRQDEWIIHAVSRYAFDEKIFPLFEIISDLETDLRKKALIRFIETNNDYSIFEKLEIVSISDLIFDSKRPYLENEIKLCESVLCELSNTSYLRHKALIRKNVNSLKKSLKDEEIRELLRESIF